MESTLLTMFRNFGYFAIIHEVAEPLFFVFVSQGEVGSNTGNPQ